MNICPIIFYQRKRHFGLTLRWWSCRTENERGGWTRGVAVMRTLWFKNWQDRLRPLIHVMKCYNAASAQQTLKLSWWIVSPGRSMEHISPSGHQLLEIPRFTHHAHHNLFFLSFLNRAVTRASLATPFKIFFLMKDQMQAQVGWLVLVYLVNQLEACWLRSSGWLSRKRMKTSKHQSRTQTRLQCCE